MQEHDECTIEFADLGDATTETKQVSPAIPFYADSTFGLGERPNS